jgi:hypothetical protein
MFLHKRASRLDEQLIRDEVTDEVLILTCAPGTHLPNDEKKKLACGAPAGQLGVVRPFDALALRIDKRLAPGHVLTTTIRRS